MLTDFELAALRAAVPIEDLGEGLAVAVRMPRHHKTTTIQVRNGLLILVAGSRGIDPELVALGFAFGIIHLPVDAPGVALVLIVGIPGDNETTVIKRRNRGLLLLSIGVRVDLELVALRRAVGTEALSEDTGIAVVLALLLISALPGDDKVTALQCGDTRIGLLCARVHIVRMDLELTAQHRAVGTMKLPVDPVSAAVLALRFPSRHKIAVFQTRRRRVLLIAIGIGVDLELVGARYHGRQHQFAGAIATAGRNHGCRLGIGIDCAHQAGPDLDNRVTRLCLIADVMTIDGDRVDIPDLTRKRDLADLARHHGSVDRHHVIAVTGIHDLGIADDRRIVTSTKSDGVVAGAKIDQQVGRTRNRFRIVTVRSGVQRHLRRRRTRRIAGHADIEALAVNTVTRTILTAGFPGDHEAAIRKRGYRRVDLLARNIGVGHELVANRRACAIEQLTADIRAGATVLATVILPGHNKAGVRALKSRHRRQVLGAAGPGVDPEVPTQDLRRC